MKAKRLLSFLLVVTMLFRMVSATTPPDDTLDQIISRGIGSSTAYLQEQLANAAEVTYGYEWYIITLSRAGKTIDAEILEEYTNSALSKIDTWTISEKPTDVERVALALAATGTDVAFAELIYNNARLSDGANELADSSRQISSSFEELHVVSQKNTVHSDNLDKQVNKYTF